MKKKAKAALRRYRKFFLFLLHISIFFVVIAIFKNIFSVSTIRVDGSSRLRGLELAYNRCIFLVSIPSLKKKLYDHNPRISSIKITKEYPSTLSIVVERDPVAAVLEVEGGYLYLTSSGRVVEKNREVKIGYPMMSYYQKFNFSQYHVGSSFQSQDIQDALFFVDRASDLGVVINSVDIGGFDMLILNSGEKQYLLTTSRDRELQYEELKTIIERFRIEKTEYKSVDLRFEKPVVTLKEN